MSGSRRTASPVRLCLNPLPGGDIDGAWWPHTGSLANELPEFVNALHAQLGEIVDMNINWSATAGAPILTASQLMSNMHWQDDRQRVIDVTGQAASARLLVIPHTTRPPLGWMILRRAASIAMSHEEQRSAEFELAGRVIRAAGAQDALSADHGLETADTNTPMS
ncbi:MAG: hypothetical protein K0U84_07725 [Actinomycetia bacterium]|nr:hypothetical protein [Actinomycetes bacterium]